VAKPAWQVVGEPAAAQLARLPGPLKIAGGVAAAGLAAKSFLDTTAPWRDQPAPPPKKPPQGAISP
jgi:hypothetical protein